MSVTYVSTVELVIGYAGVFLTSYGMYKDQTINTSKSGVSESTPSMGVLQ